MDYNTGITLFLCIFCISVLILVVVLVWRAGRPPDITKLEQERNVKRLVKTLEHADTEIAMGAAQALARLRNPQAVEPLFAVFQAMENSPKSRARKLEFAMALAKLGDSRVLDYLTGFLSYTPGGEEGRKEQGKAYLAIRELGAITFDYFKGMPDYKAIKSLGLSGDPRAFDLLLPELKNMTEKGYPMRRRAAAFGLGWLGDNRAVKPLIDALKDKDGPTRVNAAEALGRLGDKRAVVPLLAAIAFGGSYQGHFDAAAVKALTAIRDPRTNDVVNASYKGPLLDYDPYEFSASVKKALRDIGGPEVEQELGRYGKGLKDLR